MSDPLTQDYIKDQIRHHQDKLVAEIGPFSMKTMSRKDRDRRRPAVLIEDRMGDQYVATAAVEGEPQFIPGVAIRVLVTNYLGEK